MLSGLYSLLNARRNSAPIVYLTAATYSHEVTDPADASASLTFNSDRSMSSTGDVSPVDPYWLSSGLGSGYELYVAPTSGTFTSGTTGSWVSLSSNRTYTVSRTTTGLKSCTANFTIRDAATLVETGPVAITITAFVDV